MNKKKLTLIIFSAILAVQMFIALVYIKSDMSHIGEEHPKIHEFMGVTIPLNGVNIDTLQNTWGIMGILIILGFLATRNMKQVPGRLQFFFEMIIDGFYSICKSTLGEKRGRLFLPYMLTLFLFILLSNYAGLIPLPFITEPTRDLNTTLGLGLIAFFTSHIAAIRYKGIGKYVAAYFEPMVEIKGVKIPNVIFAPLNVIGEVGKLVSHSFRLFGNIMGGGIIVAVISNLVHYVALPIGLNLFFGLFSGAVQSFVFSMLAVTYIAVLIED